MSESGAHNGRNGTAASTPPAPAAIELSVVIPLYDEEENVDPVLSELLGVLDGLGLSSEVVLVDDGSKDRTVAQARGWSDRDPRVHLIEFRRNFGQTAALSAGFDHARGRVIVAMDGDQQNDPRDIPQLLAKLDEGYDVVSGWRRDRQDALLLRKLPSAAANRLISRVTGTRIHDYGCTLKAYRRDVISDLPLYGDMHRFIPALAQIVGAQVTELPVNHRARVRGHSKYGISRTIRVLLDLITVKFLISYFGRPMRLFGGTGLASMALGALTLSSLLVDKFALGHLRRNRPLLLLGMLLVMLGAQFLSLGIVGELIIRVYHEKRPPRSYLIRRFDGADSDTSVGAMVRGFAGRTENGSRWRASADAAVLATRTPADGAGKQA